MCAGTHNLVPVLFLHHLDAAAVEVGPAHIATIAFALAGVARQEVERHHTRVIATLQRGAQFFSKPGQRRSRISAMPPPAPGFCRAGQGWRTHRPTPTTALACRPSCWRPMDILCADRGCAGSVACRTRQTTDRRSAHAANRNDADKPPASQASTRPTATWFCWPRHRTVG